MSLEEKLAKRAQEIEDGILEAPVVAFQKDGGKIMLPGRMSKQEYEKFSKQYGSLGKLKPIHKPSQHSDNPYSSHSSMKNPSKSSIGQINNTSSILKQAKKIVKIEQRSTSQSMRPIESLSQQASLESSPLMHKSF